MISMSAGPPFDVSSDSSRWSRSLWLPGSFMIGPGRRPYAESNVPFVTGYLSRRHGSLVAWGRLQPCPQRVQVRHEPDLLAPVRLAHEVSQGHALAHLDRDVPHDNQSQPVV